MAEFFVPKSGWVPVDISGTLVHKPNDPNALFGKARLLAGPEVILIQCKRQSGSHKVAINLLRLMGRH